MTEAEMEHWALAANCGPQRTEWMRVHVQRCVLVPSSKDLILLWAQVMFRAKRVGKRIETADAWIAATALLYDAPLLTNNAADFAGVPGLSV